MKLLRCLLLFMIFISGCVLCAAQTKPPESQLPPPPPANDYFPQRWKEFTSPEGRFKILFPSIPKQSYKIVKSSVYNFVSYESFIFYVVLYTDIPQPLDNPATVKEFLDAERDGSLSAIVRESPRIIKKSDISLNGHPGRFIHVELARDKVTRSKWILVKNRLYFVSVTTPKGHEGVLGAENDYEKIAMSFLDSFKLIE